MLGLMQDWPLTVDKILDHARTWHGDREVVTNTVEGGLARATYAEIHRRAKQASNAFRRLGIRKGDRVGTLAWNTQRHLEIWYAVMGMGAVVHTLNPRLHADQLVYIINHAGDRIIAADTTFIPILEAVLPRCPKVERVILLTDEAHMPAARPKRALCYETLIAREKDTFPWGGFDEKSACGLCYTSGTTGDPKGVLYSHRSNFLHALIGLQPDVLGCSASDVILPVVPMFHANSWGLAFMAPAVGAKLVMPGPHLDGASIHGLLENERCTYAAAVPTIWQGLLAHLQANGLKLTSLKRVLIGGSACPESLIRAFHDHYGVDVRHGWGMTEMSPLGAVSSPDAYVHTLPFEEQLPYLLSQGRPPVGVEVKVVGQDGKEVPRDGATPGNLKVRGLAVVRSYFRAKAKAVGPDGFFDTGDIANLGTRGYIQLVDRAKDLIKSGGEWISSIDIENIVCGHPKVLMAAVIAMPHPKWDERPVLVVKLKPGQTSTPEEMLAWLDGKIAKWWTPDHVVFMDDLPIGPTGKIEKKTLRARLPELLAGV